MFKVFVYGTLKPNEINYAYYCQGKVIEETRAFIYGQLYHLPMFAYPAAVAGEGKIEGFLLTFADNRFLADLDELEDYQEGKPLKKNGYQRCLVEVYSSTETRLGKAWAYFMTFEQIKALGGVLEPSGWWSLFN